MALNEMRRLLGVMRDEGDGPVAFTPAADRDSVDQLADGLRQAGWTSASGWRATAGRCRPGSTSAPAGSCRKPLPTWSKHTGPATVAVTVSHAPDSVTVKVVDDGRGASTTAADGHTHGGHGLVGMPERWPSSAATSRRGAGSARVPGGGDATVRAPRHQRGPTITVLVADDQRVVRAGFRVLIVLAATALAPS